MWASAHGQTLEQYIQVYCNYQQDNWYQLLPLGEFTYNNAPSATMKVTPFYANKGYHLNLTVHPERDLTSPQAQEFITDLDELHQHLQENKAAAQLRYQGTANAHRLLAPKFPIDSRAFIKALFFRTMCPLKKLADKFLGPYEVIVQPGTHLVTLQLPDNLHAIHLVFHISMLEPATPNTIPNQVQPPPLPVFIDGELEFEIAEILNSKVDQHPHNCKLLYLVHWTGYAGTDKETSWILVTELRNAPKLVVDYHAAYPAKLGPLH